jgi:excisionase family DNA binding protein
MSYLSKVRTPIEIIQPIDDVWMYETTDAARYVSCSASTLRELCRAGDVKYTAQGTRYRIEGRALVDLVSKDRALRAERNAKATEEKRARDRQRWHERKDKRKVQQALPVVSKQTLQSALLAEIDRLRARVVQLTG